MKMDANGIDSVGVLSGLMSNGRMDSRAPTASSNMGGQQGNGGAQQQLHHQQQQSQQQTAAAMQRNRMIEVDAQADRLNDPPDDYYIADLYQQLSQVILSKPTEIEPLRIG
jgi:hypothetical protein